MATAVSSTSDLPETSVFYASSSDYMATTADVSGTLDYTITGVTELYTSEDITLDSASSATIPKSSTPDYSTSQEFTADTDSSATILTQTTSYTDITGTTDMTASILPPSTELEALSKIPLQFMIQVAEAVPSCHPGDYIPAFLPPTPRQGETLQAKAGTKFQISLKAYAQYDSIHDFKISGPSGISKGNLQTLRSNIASMMLEWTPEEKDAGESFPICFTAETQSWYQSEMQCVIVLVVPTALGNTTLMCNENTMTLIIEKTRNTELYEGHMHLIDPDCLISSNDTHLIASVEYSSCGTEIEETDEDIVFLNRITSFDGHSAITRKNQIVIPMNCSFPKKSRISTSFHAHRADYEFIEAGFGHFNYTFQFYTDDQFVEELSQYPLEVSLRDPLYLGIQVSSSIPNVELFVESCRATPHDNPNDPVFYDIIQNGCILDDTVISYPKADTQFHITMESFAFIGYHEEVYISCTVILCKVGGPTRCSQGCVKRSPGDNQRRKRSAGSESQQHSISQGPLRLKKPAEINSDVAPPQALNMNTLVISVSGVVIVALAAFIVYIMVKKSTGSTNYEKL
ncbi:ZP domain-containing protein-like [Hyperolius riggenbachi]|uniref:ZP domain-containing protein-like n=1 Tax=Hyperolius riggenbachi TaxID=752182 RepID=UPI0035A345AF